MKKFRDMLEKIIDTGKVPKCCTMSDVYALFDVYNDLVTTGKSEFIQHSVKTILENCKINVAPKGIGWIAYI